MMIDEFEVKIIDKNLKSSIMVLPKKIKYLSLCTDYWEFSSKKFAQALFLIKKIY